MMPLSLRQLWGLVIVCGAGSVQRMRSGMLVSMLTFRVLTWMRAVPAEYVDYVADRGIE